MARSATPGSIRTLGRRVHRRGHALRRRRPHRPLRAPQRGRDRVGELAQAEVDAARRDQSRRHHTATHLLHRALKDVLGEGTSQQGSYVGPDQLRFDFNEPRGMTPPSRSRTCSTSSTTAAWTTCPSTGKSCRWIARARLGAVDDVRREVRREVRVVSIGDYSRELCGGTHTHHSGELGTVVIASESGIGSGKRRIVAYAGQRRAQLSQSAARSCSTALAAAAWRAQRRRDRQPRRRAAGRDRRPSAATCSAASSSRRTSSAAPWPMPRVTCGGCKVVAASVESASQDDLKRLVDAVRDDLQSGVVVLGSVQDGRVPLVAGVSRDLTSTASRATCSRPSPARPGAVAAAARISRPAAAPSLHN